MTTIEEVIVYLCQISQVNFDHLNLTNCGEILHTEVNSVTIKYFDKLEDLMMTMRGDHGGGGES